MKKDLPENTVEDIGMAIVLEEASPENKIYKVYLVNLKNTSIHTVLISSRGYGIKDGENVKTSTFRHMIEKLEAQEYAMVEPIMEEVFGLTNEFWLSFYIGNTIYDKKFIFLPESIVESNFIRIPILNKPGVMIK